MNVVRIEGRSMWRSAPPAPDAAGRAPWDVRRRELGLFRSADNRVLTGVAGGLGERLGVDPTFVRAGFLVLALAGGAGVPVYLLAYVLTAEPATSPPRRRRRTASSALALGLVVVGVMLVLQDIGLWFGSGVVWPLALAVLGSAVMWARSDEADRQRLARLAGRLPGDPLRALFAPGPAVVVRVGVGGVLVLAGLVTLLAATDAVLQLGSGLVAVLATVLGTVLVFGPAIARLGRTVTEERRERIRSEERADMAAHLHDSVLQTLALIQRSSEPREMAALARAQERELRAWLYGRTGDQHDLLSTAVEEVADLVEQRYHVKVEVVVVGDGRLDGRSRALVSAVGEALHNAARHSGATIVSVYVEGTPDAFTAYVTDEGSGFDLSRVPPDRRGIADSIVGRVERHGGTATITSDAEGTEVHLSMPRGS
jgi:signal transduction histidine kinase